MRGSSIRGAALLTVAGVALAVAMLSPGQAAITKQKVKKVAAKVAARQDGRVAVSVDTADGQPLIGPTPGDPTVHESVSVAAPAPGYLVVEGWIDSFTIPGGLELFTCSVRVNGVKVESSDMEVQVDAATDGENAEENCITHAVVPVAAGTHTVGLVTEEVDLTSTLTDGIGVSAMYVPFDGSGQRPTAFAVT